MAWLFGAVLVSWAAPCLALPSFPGDVDQFLMMPGLVEKLFPMTMTSAPGCNLCHLDGGGSELGPFGNSLGLSPSTVSDPALFSALASLESTNPRGLDDLKMGINPNTDPAFLSADPSPQYGCTIGSSRREAGRTDVLIWCCIAAMTTVCYRRRRAKPGASARATLRAIGGIT